MNRVEELSHQQCDDTRKEDSGWQENWYYWFGAWYPHSMILKTHLKSLIDTNEKGQGRCLDCDTVANTGYPVHITSRLKRVRSLKAHENETKTRCA